MYVNQKVVLVLFLPIIWMIFFVYQPKIFPVGLTPETYCKRASSSGDSSSIDENIQCQKSLMIDMSKRVSVYIFFTFIFFLFYLTVQFILENRQIRRAVIFLYVNKIYFRVIFLLLAILIATFVFFYYNPKSSPRFFYGHEYCTEISSISTSDSSSLSAKGLFEMMEEYRKQEMVYDECIDKLPIILEMKYEVYALLLASILIIFGVSKSSKET